MIAHDYNMKKEQKFFSSIILVTTLSWYVCLKFARVKQSENSTLLVSANFRPYMK